MMANPEIREKQLRGATVILMTGPAKSRFRAGMTYKKANAPLRE